MRSRYYDGWMDACEQFSRAIGPVFRRPRA
jgi:hypothetical protein